MMLADNWAMHAAIFDLDGLLIDSEPLWRAAQVDVFGALGVPLTLEDCAQTTGLRLDDVVAWRRAQHPWQGPSDGEVFDRIIDRMIAAVQAHGRPMPGALAAVAACQAAGVPVAVATSSPARLVTPCLTALGLRDAVALWCSAEDDPLGKPHPAVYLRAAERLGVPPTACLAIEDSLTGLIAAKAARMRAVAVPAPEHQRDPRFALADWRLSSLQEFQARVLTVIEPAR